MPAHRDKIIMTDLAYEHVTGTFFSNIATLKYKYYFYARIGVYEKVTATRITDGNSKVLAT
jgi:hypothetical protein